MRHLFTTSNPCKLLSPWRIPTLWNGRDLERKLADFQAYYNAARSHASLDGHTPFAVASGHPVARADLNNIRWASHCRDLVQLPAAA